MSSDILSFSYYITLSNWSQADSQVLVFGGSPKGEKSVTMQYVKWLQKNHPEHHFDVVQVAQPITRIEKNDGVTVALLVGVIRREYAYKKMI